MSMPATFDSVWEAIEDDPLEVENLKIRSALMMALEAHIRKMKWTQVEAARRLRVTQPRISDLMRGKIGLFAIVALVAMASAAGLRIELRISEAA